jgi:hypothetical protein
VRWRQDRHTGEMVPLDAAAARSDGHAIHASNFEAFISPVDGSTISTAKGLREHNLRNNVVNAAEFTPEFYAQKAEERAKIYQGEHSPKEKFERKQEIYNALQRAEENGYRN